MCFGKALVSAPREEQREFSSTGLTLPCHLLPTHVRGALVGALRNLAQLLLVFQTRSLPYPDFILLSPYCGFSILLIHRFFLDHHPTLSRYCDLL